MCALVLLLTTAAGCRLPANPALSRGLPAHPQRVVVVAPQIFEDTLALGVLPVGATRSPADRAMLPPAAWQSIVPLTNPANIEQVLALHPDLILTVATGDPDSLERAAPTYNVKAFTNFLPWRDRYRRVAHVLHHETEAETGIADSERKTLEVKRDFQGHPFRVLMGYVSGETRSITVFPVGQNTAQLIEAVGLHYGTLRNRKPGSDDSVTLSWERVDDMDCDAFFVTPAANNDPASLQQIRQQLVLLDRQPLWRQLPFVRAKRVFFMDNYWQMITPLTADRVMEDLERNLLGRDLDAEWHLHAPVAR